MCLGLYLLGNKYANPEEYAAFWLMLAFFIIFAIIDISFGFYQAIACKLKGDWVTYTVKETEMKPVGEGDTDPPKKSPSPVSSFVNRIGAICKTKHISYQLYYTG